MRWIMSTGKHLLRALIRLVYRYLLGDVPRSDFEQRIKRFEKKMNKLD